MRSRSLLIVAVAVAIVAAGAGGAIWFTGRDTPDAVDIERAIADVTTAPAAPSGTDGAAEADASVAAEPAPITDATGTWTVDTEVVAFDTATGAGTWVGYRIDEELSGIGAYTAVGRSPRVEGEVVIDGGRVLEAVIRADLQGLVSDNGNRDSRVRPLFADRHVVFALSGPVVFGGEPEAPVRASGTASRRGSRVPCDRPRCRAADGRPATRCSGCRKATEGPCRASSPLGTLGTLGTLETLETLETLASPGSRS